MLRRHLMLLAGIISAVAAVGESQSLSTPGGRPPAKLQMNLGHHHYPVNGRAEAQAWFDQGLRLFWSADTDAAALSFREAERLDPGCAMCAFGVALALSFADLAPGPGRSAPGDSAGVAIARARAAVRDPMESRLIEALTLRLAGRDALFADSLAGFVADHPANLEARALLALALSHAARADRWPPAPGPITVRLLAQLDTVLAVDPAHPGACHLLVLVVERSDPTRAMPCARRVAESMPGARRMAHLPARVYRGLAFTESLRGASEAALDAAFRAQRAVDRAAAAALPDIDAIGPTGTLTLVTFGRWDRILGEPLPRPGTRYATGVAYYARGVAFAAKRRWAEARAALDSVSRIAGAHVEGGAATALLIAERALAGEIALRRGSPRDAIREFRSAAMLQDGARQALWYYPMRHSLGLALIKAGRFREAEQVYREDLAVNAENGWSLYGLAQALKALGRLDEAGKVVDRFNRAWTGADVALSGSRF